MTAGVGASLRRPNAASALRFLRGLDLLVERLLPALVEARLHVLLLALLVAMQDECVIVDLRELLVAYENEVQLASIVWNGNAPAGVGLKAASGSE
jgi:hypothetical protein